MNKITFLLGAALFLVCSLSLTAQEYSIDMNSGQLMIQEVNRVDIEGHSGSSIIISTEGYSKKEDKRADGLREINAMGYNDNTGIGLSAEKDGSTVYLNQISRSGGKRYTIKVPKGVSVNYEHSSWEGKTINIRNVEGEVEVSANYNQVKLENVTGPIAINTVYGGIDAVFGTLSSENDILLHSVYDDVDVTVATSAKAVFTLNTSFGRIYTDLKLEFERDKGKMRELTNKKIQGNLNGGGVNVKLKSTYKNIYLRSK